MGEPKDLINRLSFLGPTFNIRILTQKQITHRASHKTEILGND